MCNVVLKYALVVSNNKIAKYMTVILLKETPWIMFDNNF